MWMYAFFCYQQNLFSTLFHRRNTENFIFAHLKLSHLHWGINSRCEILGKVSYWVKNELITIGQANDTDARAIIPTPPGNSACRIHHSIFSFAAFIHLLFRSSINANPSANHCEIVRLAKFNTMLLLQPHHWLYCCLMRRLCTSQSIDETEKQTKKTNRRMGMLCKSDDKCEWKNGNKTLWRTRKTNGPKIGSSTFQDAVHGTDRLACFSLHFIFTFSLSHPKTSYSSVFQTPAREKYPSCEHESNEFGVSVESMVASMMLL